MCSIDDSELDGENIVTEMMKSDHKVLTDDDKCRKCKTSKADVILREKDYYCKECFTVYFVHKFRSTIGKSKEIKHDDRILVAYSAGLNSTALLHLIRRGLNEESTKRIKFHPHVLFIDESTVISSSPSLEKAYEEAIKLNFPFSCTSFEEVLKEENAELVITTIKESDEKCNINEIVHKNSDLSNELVDLLEQRLKSRTSREDFVRHLRVELICRCAKQLDFEKVFVADNATELSVQILSIVALGRGSQLADNVQFKSRHFGIEVFRPLREIFDDEVKFYIESEKILVLDHGSKPVNSRPSVVSCTRDFIYGLQKEFFSTVPTIFRTGGKLVSGNTSDDINGEETEELCLSCGLRRETINSTNCSALKSIKLSKKLTCSQPPNSVNEREESSHMRLDCTDDELFQDFCYGCSNLIREMGSLDFYPPRIRKKILEKQGPDQAKSLIQDYLLED